MLGLTGNFGDAGIIQDLHGGGVGNMFPILQHPDDFLVRGDFGNRFAIGEKVSADPVEMYLNDVFTVTVNMAGLPGLVTPAGLSGDGLPLGLQLIGRPFDEETLFAIGATLEDAAGPVRPPEPWWA